MLSVYDNLGQMRFGTGLPSGTMTMVNVRDYGATGDGSTNDAAAIQAAINAAGAMGVSGRGVDVFFPAGVYAINTAIAVPFNNVMLTGAGWQSTVIYASHTTGDIVQLGNGTTKAGCGLRNMSVWCSAARTAGYSINVNAMNDCVIEDFVINNCFYGVYIQGVSIKVWVRRGEINNAHVTDGGGVVIANGAAGDTYLQDLIMSNNPANKPAAGISVAQTGHMAISRCNVTSFIYGLYLAPGANQDVSYVYISDSLFDSCGTAGMAINPTSATACRVRSLIATNSWFSGSVTNPGYGIYVTGTASGVVDGMSFIGCRILNNNREGVYNSFAAATNISFTDCTIAGNGQQASNTYDGVTLVANTSGWAFVNCKIGQAGTAGNQQRYAVNVAAGTSANLLFAYNDCQPNGTLGNMGYIQLGAITGGGNIFINNQPVIPRSFGNARVAATSAFTTSETIVSDQTAAYNRLLTNAIRAGSSLRFTISGTTTISTAAGTTQWRVRLGTNNSTSDAVIMDSTALTTGGVGGPIAFRIVLDLTFRTTGGSATCYGTFTFFCQNATGGILAQLTGVVNGTASTFSTQNANYINITGVGSANASVTVQICIMEPVNT